MGDDGEVDLFHPSMIALGGSSHRTHYHSPHVPPARKDMYKRSNDLSLTWLADSLDGDDDDGSDGTSANGNGGSGGHDSLSSNGGGHHTSRSLSHHRRHTATAAAANHSSNGHTGGGGATGGGRSLHGSISARYRNVPVARPPFSAAGVPLWTPQAPRGSARDNSSMLSHSGGTSTGTHFGRAVSPPSPEVPLSAPTAFVAYNLPRAHQYHRATNGNTSTNGTGNNGNGNSNGGNNGNRVGRASHLPMLPLHRIRQRHSSSNHDNDDSKDDNNTGNHELSKTAPHRLGGASNHNHNNGGNGNGSGVSSSGRRVREEKELSLQNGSSLVKRMLRDDARIERIAANINQSGADFATWSNPMEREEAAAIISKRVAAMSHEQLKDRALGHYHDSSVGVHDNEQKEDISDGNGIATDELTAIISRAKANLAEEDAAYDAWQSSVTSMAVRIFRAKCEDIGVNLTGHREDRFVANMILLCKQGKLSLTDQGLGPRAAHEIAKFMESRTKGVPLLKMKKHMIPITSLYLSGNSIENDGAIALAPVLCYDTNITAVDLRSNAITSKGFKAIFDAIRNNSSITSLDLSSSSAKGNMYIGPGSHAASSLCTLLRTNVTLTELSLQNCGIGLIPEGMELVSDGLQQNSVLTSLDLSCNALGHREMSLLCRALNDATSSALQAILLRNNQIGSYGASRLADLIAGTFGGESRRANSDRPMASLTKLDISRNDIRVAGLALLTDALRDHAGFAKLIMDGNILGARPQLSHLLEKKGDKADTSEDAIDAMMANVDHLQLRHTVVSRHLAMNRSLRCLSLCEAGIKDFFISQLVEALPNEVGITHLLLGRNMIKRDGAVSLASFMRTNTTLRVLDLSTNRIDDHGGLSLAESLIGNTSLLQLNLDNNEMADRSAEAILKLLTNNRTLTSCNVDGNKIPFRVYKKVCDLGLRNRIEYDKGRISRQEVVIDKLHEQRIVLQRTMDDIDAAQRQLDDDEATLAELRSEEYKALEKHLTDQLKDELARQLENHRDLDGREFELDSNTRRTRQDQDTRVDFLKLRIDKTRTERLTLVKIRDQDRHSLSRVLKNAAQDDDDAGRLMILLQAAMKKTAEAKIEWEMETDLLKRFIATLDKPAGKDNKRNRGVTSNGALSGNNNDIMDGRSPPLSPSINNNITNNDNGTTKDNDGNGISVRPQPPLSSRPKVSRTRARTRTTRSILKPNKITKHVSGSQTLRSVATNDVSPVRRSSRRRTRRRTRSTSQSVSRSSSLTRSPPNRSSSQSQVVASQPVVLSSISAKRRASAKNNGDNIANDASRHVNDSNDSNGGNGRRRRRARQSSLSPQRSSVNGNTTIAIQLSSVTDNEHDNDDTSIAAAAAAAAAAAHIIPSSVPPLDLSLATTRHDNDSAAAATTTTSLSSTAANARSTSASSS